MNGRKLFLLSFLIVLLSISFVNAVSNNDFDVWYSFDNSNITITNITIDLIGNANATATDIQKGLTGVIDENFYFKDNGVLTLPITDNTFNKGEAFSMGFWFKKNDTPNGDYTAFWRFNDGSNYIRHLEYGTENKWSFQMEDDAGHTCGFEFANLTGYTNDNWHYFVFTQNGTTGTCVNDFHLFLDNKEQTLTLTSTNAVVNTFTTNGADYAYVGNDNTLTRGSQHIDEFFFINDKAINKSTISYLYNNSNPTTAQQPPFTAGGGAPPPANASNTTWHTPVFPVNTFTIDTNITAGSYIDQYSLDFNYSLAPSYNYSIPDYYAYWKLDDNVNDYNKNFNGTEVGITYTGGKHNNAAVFDGINDYVNISHHPALNQTGDMTIIGWVYPKDRVVGSDAIISNTNGSVSSNAGGFILEYGSNKFTYTAVETDTTNSSKIDKSITSASYPKDTWYFIAITHSTTTAPNIYVNGILDNAGGQTNEAGNHYSKYATVIGAAHGISNNYLRYDGYIDELRLYNRTLNIGEISRIYNSTITQFTCNLLDDTVIVDTTNVTNMNITYDFELNTFGMAENHDINITCTDNYLTDSEQETLFINSTEEIKSISYGNYSTLDTLNYTRQIQFNYTYICDGNANIYTYQNGLLNTTTAATCDGTLKSGTGVYTHDVEGNFNYTVIFDNTANNISSGYKYFISDLYAPNVTSTTFNYGLDFVNPAANFSYVCNDSITPNITYNLVFNQQTMFNALKTNGTLQFNESTTLVNGYNNVTYTCTDLFSSASKTTQTDINIRTLYIIDEQKNQGFDVSNLSSVIVYLDDNRTSYDFKANGKNNISFISGADVKLRFELIYSGGTIILRYVDIGLLEDDVRVCANTEGITHYEQILTSSSERPVVLRSVFADCVVAADYTRFAYQNSKVLKAYTYNNLYYLYLFENNDPTQDQVFLASVDGSIATYINIDSLEFYENQINVNGIGEALEVNKRNANEMNIYYYNPLNDNTALRVQIVRLDTDAVLLNTTAFADPNEAQIIFNFATLTGINDTTLFRVDAISTDAVGTTMTTQYFNTDGVTGFINSTVILILSFFIFIFGLSFTTVAKTFSFFGAFVLIINIVILSFATAAWYITFFTVINVISLIYVFIVMMAKNTAQIG